jgi:amino acid adenylation domain-containing protein
MLAAGLSAHGRPAVVEYADGSVRTTSYHELAQRTALCAAGLDEFELDVGDRVMLESDTGADAIAMFLACSSRGLTFIPVSPEAPPGRLLSIAECVEPALFLQHTSGTRDGIPEPIGLARFDAGGLTVERPPRPSRRRRREIVATDPAYMIFTSGTTGRPKGVVMSHRAVVSFYRGMMAHKIVDGTARVATTSPLQFDFSLLDIGLALGSGAAVVPVPRSLLRWPTRFAEVLRATRATQVNGVPSIWRQALRHAPDRLAALSHVRGVLFCGEDFPLDELRQLQRLLPQARLVNCYGSTESMACSFADVPNPLPPDVDRLSIGQAHPGAEMTLVGPDGQIIDEPGEIGEIFLRSPALFNGYWDDPDASRAALVPDPADRRTGQTVLRTGDLAYRGADGDLYFCGRADRQVQIRGNRVELGEIERRLTGFPGIDEAVVMVLDAAVEPDLVAFVVGEETTATTIESDLHAYCAEMLPAYMVPRRIQRVDAVPRNGNGKLDRRRLAASLA